jgi:uncharacterized protein (TIGR00369 family)
VIEERIRRNFDGQQFMRLLGAELREAAGGVCVVAAPARADLTQQHGYVHAGVVGTLADTAAGYAALSLWPDDAEVLTVEFKLSLLEPVQGDEVVARAEVLRAGGRLTTCESRVTSGDVLCAVALVTLTRRRA